jgi:hypothetical protein
MLGWALTTALSGCGSGRGESNRTASAYRGSSGTKETTPLLQVDAALPSFSHRYGTMPLEERQTQPCCAFTGEALWVPKRDMPLSFGFC